MSWARLRLAAATAALAVLALVMVRLAPPYWRNQQFQRALRDVASSALRSGVPDEAVRVAAVNAAARLGIGIRLDQVTLKRAHGRLEIQALYDVHVNLPLHTVDLHFRTRARVP